MRLTLSVLALLLSGVLASQWWGWSPGGGVPGPPSDSTQPAIAGDRAGSALPEVTLDLPPREDYASVVERPLFLPERRPPEEADEPEAPAPELTELDGTDLTAVVITPALVSAWVRGPNDQEVKRLRLGDDFLGWTVKTIEPDQLVLERQGETNRLLLRDYENAPPPIPPTRLPPRRQARDADAPQSRRDIARRGAGAQDADGKPVARSPVERGSQDRGVVPVPGRRAPTQPTARPPQIPQPPRRPRTAPQ
jgi:general secretion pathway protein N